MGTCNLRASSKMNCISLIMLLLYISLLFAKTFGTRVNVRHRSLLVERKKPSQLKFRNVPAAAAPVPDEDNDEDDNDRRTQSTERSSSTTMPQVRIVSSSTHSTSTVHHHEATPETPASTDQMTHETTASTNTTTHKTWTVSLGPAAEVALDFIIHFNLTSPLTETIEALYLLNTLFRAFLDAMHPLLRFALLQWRKYQESCFMLLSDDLDDHPAEAKYIHHASHSWSHILKERDALAFKMIELLHKITGVPEKPVIFSDSYYDIEEKDSTTTARTSSALQEIVAKAVKAFSTQKAEKQLKAMTRKLLNLASSVSQYCDPFKYLICNPFFTEKEDTGLEYSQNRASTGAGHCDCRPGYEKEDDKCAVKSNEDCNLPNLLLQPDLKRAPQLLLQQLKSPACAKGLHCINDLVCGSAPGNTVTHSNFLILTTFLQFIIKQSILTFSYSI